MGGTTDKIFNLQISGRQQMRFSGFIYELYSPINYLSSHKYHHISNFEVSLEKIKAYSYFNHSIHPLPHACCYLLHVIELGWPSRLYYFAIMCQERNVIQTNKKDSWILLPQMCFLSFSD